jgi:hypothetical protein
VSVQTKGLIMGIRENIALGFEAFSESIGCVAYLATFFGLWILFIISIVGVVYFAFRFFA